MHIQIYAANENYVPTQHNPGDNHDNRGKKVIIFIPLVDFVECWACDKNKLKLNRWQIKEKKRQHFASSNYYSILFKHFFIRCLKSEIFSRVKHFQPGLLIKLHFNWINADKMDTINRCSEWI